MFPHRVSRRGGPYFPDDPAELEPDEDGLVAVGGTLGEEVLVEAYAKGIFPWFNGPPLMWFSPDPRTILRPGELRVSRRLARTLRSGRFTVRLDEDFERVIAACAAVPRPGQDGTWIDAGFVEAYTRLHRLRLAHCVAVYRGGELAGGLYGVSLGRAFFGESMFHLEPDASKAALAHLAEWTRRRGFLFIDCQVRTMHLAGLGAVEIPRAEFLRLLGQALLHPTLQHLWREEEGEDGR